MGQRRREREAAVRRIEKQLTLAFIAERELPPEIETLLAQIMVLPEVPASRGGQENETR